MSTNIDDPNSGDTSEPEQPDLTAENLLAEKEVLDATAAVLEEAQASNETSVKLLSVETQLAERTADLQRLQAEYVNYKRRVERDRTVARETTIVEIAENLIPVLDDIDLAKQHGDLLEGSPFYTIADKLENALAKYNIVRYGEVSVEFDPNIHEALLHEKDSSTNVETVKQILRPGYKVGEKVLRAAQVSVIIPE